MNDEETVRLLRDRITELHALAPNCESTEYQLWRHKAIATLQRALGPEHALATSLINTQFVVTWNEDPLLRFENGRRSAQAILEAAIYELEELAEPTDFVSDSAVDPELWEHVRHSVESEQWDQVASQACIFTEAKVRKWADRPDHEVGKDLMTAVFKPDGGVLPLGRTSGETQGWHLLAMGLAMAVRNADTHRIQERADHKRYAMGVVGTASLLLTQLRYEHGNRFRG
jgi:hypothetical protein